MRRDRRDQRGFTLLEVLIAVFVLALGLTAAVVMGGQKAIESGEVRDATYGAWVAANTLETLRLEDPWPATGRRQGEAVMGHRTWYWALTINDTEDPDLRRIDVQVFRDADREIGLTRMTGFAGRTGRQP